MVRPKPVPVDTNHEPFVSSRARQRVPLAAVVQSLCSYLGEAGSRLFIIQELGSANVVAVASSLYLEHTFFGPFPPAVLTDEPVPVNFWCFDWGHEGEKVELKQAGRGGYPEHVSMTADWIGSSFAIVMTWGAPGRKRMMCRRASNVTISKADYENFLSRFRAGDGVCRALASQDDVIRWCLDWLLGGRGRNSAEAYAHFAADPRFDDVAREAFRAAWAEAKRRKNG